MDHPVMHDRIGHDLRAGIQHLFLFHRLLDLLLRDRRKFCIPFHLYPSVLQHVSSVFIIRYFPSFPQKFHGKDGTIAKQDR